MGRSGSGKSVTLKLLLGLLKPDEGKIHVNDVAIETLDSAGLVAVRKTIGFLFQYSALFDSLSVAENVAFPLRRHTRMSEAEIEASVRERLADVGLEEQLDKMPLDLSGGMRKRVGLARALALKPSILLVDEPSSGLEPITTREIDQLLMDLKALHKTTMVVVTHNVPSARRIGDQLVVLSTIVFILTANGAEELSDTGRKRLDGMIAKFLQFTKDRAVIVEGYASAGTQAEQFLHSRERATKVRDYLVKKFTLSPDYVGVMPMGAVADYGDGIALVLLKK
jgi:phospholipid/cholesterol/gamma-HCH transport system ATP-binding protein